MLSVERVEASSSAARRDFLALPFRLYAGCPQWVPPLRAEAALVLDRRRHPFYEHSEAEFFVARREGQVVGRIAALETRPLNAHRGTRWAGFSVFECHDDPEAAAGLFARVFEFAAERGLERVVGPRGFGPFDGHGVLVDGFERRQMMTMSAYNPPHYRALLEGLGFAKEVDFVSYRFRVDGFELPARYELVAERARERGTFRVKRFASRRELRAWARRIGEAYNRSFVGNWEYYPLSERELRLAASAMGFLAEPGLSRLILKDGAVVGFLFAFPDVSRALQRCRGRLFPLGLVALLVEARRTRSLSLNGIGVLPQLRRLGGNAFLLSETSRSAKADGRYLDVEATQVAGTAALMDSDVRRLGGERSKVHRVFSRATRAARVVEAA